MFCFIFFSVCTATTAQRFKPKVSFATVAEVEAKRQDEMERATQFSRASSARSRALSSVASMVELGCADFRQKVEKKESEIKKRCAFFKAKENSSVKSMSLKEFQAKLREGIDSLQEHLKLLFDLDRQLGQVSTTISSIKDRSLLDSVLTWSGPTLEDLESKRGKLLQELSHWMLNVDLSCFEPVSIIYPTFSERLQEFMEENLSDTDDLIDESNISDKIISINCLVNDFNDWAKQIKDEFSSYSALRAKLDSVLDFSNNLQKLIKLQLPLERLPRVLTSEFDPIARVVIDLDEESLCPREDDSQSCARKRSHLGSLNVNAM